jgi:hypothetical protein
VHDGANRTLEAALQYWLQYEAPGKLRSLYRPLAFHLQTMFFEVEPRGFDPLTSAVQNQSSNITRVCRCSKTRAKRYILCANI